MVLNFSQLIKFSGAETYPAAKTQSIGLPAYAQLSLVFAEPLRQLYRDSKLCAVNRDSSIYWDYPIWQLYRDPKLRAVNRDYPISTALSGHRNFQPSAGTLSGPKRLRPSTGILQKLMPARAAVGNSLNRRAVIANEYVIRDIDSTKTTM
jgi:hypothetical protein